jgi:hypothetical protein
VVTFAVLTEDVELEAFVLFLASSRAAFAAASISAFDCCQRAQ